MTITAPLLYKTYHIRVEYVARGEGIIGAEIFSRHFLLVPTIDQIQERTRAQMYVNGVPANFSVKRDSEGNEYADPGPIYFSGAVNITLVQDVRVASPPFRGRWLLRERITWSNLEGTYPGGFWRCNSSSKSFEDLVALSNQLRKPSDTVDQYIINVVRWTLERYKYSVREEGGVTCPAAFMERMVGSCGDVHAFVAALLKLQGVNTSLVYAYIAFPEARQSIATSTISFTLEGAYPHIFVIASISGVTLPIDLTASAGSTPADKISKASVNELDNIIILYRVSGSDPNDYLLVHAPTGAREVKLTIRVAADAREDVERYAVLASGFLVLLLLLREMRST